MQLESRLHFGQWLNANLYVEPSLFPKVWELASSLSSVHALQRLLGECSSLVSYTALVAA